jgi:hypothetical protein
LQPPVPRLAKAASSVEKPQDADDEVDVEDWEEFDSEEEVASAVVAASEIPAANTT